MVSGFFTKKIAQLQSVGDILEQRRLSLGIAIERVALETGVQARYLRAIELGQAKQLPPEIYVRGFIKTYARYLRLDESAALEQWERERGIAKHLSKPTATVQLRKTFPDRRPLLPRLRLTPVVWRTSLIALVIVASLLYVWLSVTSLGRPPKLVLVEPTSDQTVTHSSIVVVGETRAEAELTINGQPVFVDAEGHFRETVSLQAGLNQIAIVAKNKLGRDTTIVRNIQANLNPVAVHNEESDVQEESSVSQKDGVDLTLNIRDEATWVSVEVDSEPIFEGTLLPNSRKHFSGEQSIRLTTGKAQHTAIEFNGERLDALGEGFMRDLEFTPDLKLQDLTTTAARE
jgi:cytoskeleton protein RodZ